MDIIPNANAPDQVWNYEDIAIKCDEVRRLLPTLKIRFHRDSALGVLLREAEALARDWKEERRDGGMRRLMNAAHANRIVNAILAVKDEPGARNCIQRMAGNNVNLSQRSPSQGKDALWELDLAVFMRRRGVEAELIDPPDIVADFGFGPYPIACKKVYSEKGVEARLSSGANQLKAFGSPGLVAINIDDLVPADALLQSATHLTASDFLAKLNEDFMERHRFHMQRFVIDGRCDGVLISTTVLADIVHSSTRFNTHTQTTLWSLTSARPEAAERLSRVREALGILP